MGSTQEKYSAKAMITGNIQFDANGDSDATAWMMDIEDGKQTGMALVNIGGQVIKMLNITIQFPQEEL